MKKFLRVALVFVVCAIAGNAIAGNRNLWTGTIKCSPQAHQFPTPSGHPLQKFTVQDNDASVAAFIGTGSSMTATGTVNFALAKGGATRDYTLTDPSLLWCITSSSTAQLVIFGEYGISN